MSCQLTQCCGFDMVSLIPLCNPAGLEALQVKALQRGRMQGLLAAATAERWQPDTVPRAALGTLQRALAAAAAAPADQEDAFDRLPAQLPDGCVSYSSSLQLPQSRIVSYCSHTDRQCVACSAHFTTLLPGAGFLWRLLLLCWARTLKRSNSCWRCWHGRRSG